MQDSQTPPKFLLPWAASAGGGYINAIPVTSQIGITNGAASLTDGFPPLTFVPLDTGGAGPFGKDFNGVLKQITQGVQWSQAGGPIFYDASFSTAIAGYPKGALLSSTATAGQLWISTAENNTSDPDTGGANWVALLVRPTVIAPTDFYVSTAGNDANPGTSGLPWATLQKAWDYLTSIDMNGESVTVHVSNGTYAPLNAYSVFTGQPSIDSVVFVGNVSTPAACVIAATNDDCILATNGARFVVRGFRFTATGSGANQGCGIQCLSGASVFFDTVEFGICANAHFVAGTGAFVAATGGYTISGGAARHIAADQNGIAQIGQGVTVTLSGTPAFSSEFALAARGGIMLFGNAPAGVTFTGSATGTRFDVSGGGGIDTAGSGSSYLPGSISGVADAGTFGWYA